MTDAERSQLHADVARLMAPIVGEAAVYDCVYWDECPNHGKFEVEERWRGVDLESTCAYCGLAIRHNVDRVPLNFSDPAVLAPVTESLGADRGRGEVMLGLQISRLQDSDGDLYWHVRIRWALDEYRADGTTLGDAWALALRAALEGEKGVSIR